MALGSGTRGTYHELKKLFTEIILLNMVLTSSTILSHKVLKGQHHVVQEFVEHRRRGCSGGTPQPTNPDRPSCQIPLFDTPEPEPCTCEEMLVHNSVQRPLLRVFLNFGLEFEDRESRERMWVRDHSLVQEMEERETRHLRGEEMRCGKPVMEKKVWATNRFWHYDPLAAGDWS
jgi:hypothetical protein